MSHAAHYDYNTTQQLGKIHIMRQKQTNYPAPIQTTATVRSESQNTNIFESPPAMSAELQSKTKYKHSIYYILEEASTNLIPEKCDAPSLTPHTYICTQPSPSLVPNSTEQSSQYMPSSHCIANLSLSKISGSTSFKHYCHPPIYVEYTSEIVNHHSYLYHTFTFSCDLYTVSVQMKS